MRRLFAAAATAALVAGTVTALSLPAAAGPPAPDPEPSADQLTAMWRDLGLTPTEAKRRNAAIVPAATTQAVLRDRLGTRFGGAWMADDGVTPVVGVTDPSAAAEVSAVGARPVVVARGVDRLDRVKAALDARASSVPSPVPVGVHGWHVDVRTNTVVVTAHPSAVAEAAAFADGYGTAVRVRTSAAAPRPHMFRNIRGGEALYDRAGGRCSIGFAVIGGYVTAGHCGDVGEYLDGYNHETQGLVRGSSFPGDDYAWVETTVQWIPQGVVYNWGPSYQGVTAVEGSVEAPVGAPVCRSGSTTGWRCGTVLALNLTVNYGGGIIVTGLTETSACSDLGDSGGSFLAGGQAQGVLSGGAGDCTTGGTSVFQPVNEILTRYGLTLITTATPLALHDLSCVVEQGGRLPEYRCTITYNGGAPPYTHTWQFNNGTPYQAGATVAGVCRSAGGYTVRVTVRDAWNRSMVVTTGFGCP
jgi:streptogrisin C